MTKRPTRRPNSRSAFLKLLREDLWGGIKSTLKQRFEWLQSLVVRPGRVRVPKKAKPEPKLQTAQRQLVSPEGLEVRKLLAGDVFVLNSSNLDEDDFFAGGFVIAAEGGNVGSDVEVSYSIGGTASGADYTPLSGVATITAGSSFTTVDVTPINDDVLEPTETVQITLTGTDDAVSFPLKATSITGEVAIFDDDVGTLSLAAVDAVASEIAGNDGEFAITFEGNGVNLTNASPTTVTLGISGTATNGEDYASIATTHVIPADTESYTIPVDVISDTINFDDGEDVILEITGISSAHSSSKLTFDTTPDTVTIDDPSRAIASLVATDTTVSESGSPQVVYDVVLDRSISTGEGSVTLAIDLAGGATAGDDYSAPSTSVVFTEGDSLTVASVTLTVTDDSLIEGDETIEASLSYVGGLVAVDGANNTHDATIIDDDAGTLEITAGTVSEDAGTAEVTLSLGSVAVGSDTTFALTYGGDTEAADFSAALPTQAIMTAGASSVVLTLTIDDDNLVEGDESLVVSASVAGGTSVAIGDSGTLGILDNDETTYSITGNSAVESDDAVFDISLTNPVEAATVLSYSTSSVTAESPGDYQVGSGLVTVAAGESTAALTISVTDDSIVEFDETFEVALTGTAATSVVAGSPTTATATIVDNDAAVVNLQAPTATINEPDSVTEQQSYLVVLNHPVAQPTTVTIGLGGTATDPDDYSPASGTTVVIPANQQVASLTIDFEADTLIEDDETVIASITGVGSAAGLTVTAGSNATMTIEDDDSAEVSLVADSVTVTEGGTAELTFAQTGVATTDTVIEYTLVPGAGTGGATTADYTGTTGTVTILDGETAATVSIATVDDMLVEPEQEFTVQFSIAASDPSISLTSTDASVAITDNDSAELSISGPTSLAEGDSGETTLSYTVGMTSTAEYDVSVVVESVDGTAVDASDYDALDETVVIPAGSLSVPFTVTVNGDTDVESNETFAVSLTSVDAVGADVTVGASGDLDVTIVDDDVATVSLSGPASVTEGTATSGSTDAVFTLSLNAPSSQDTVLDVSTAGGTAASGTDFTALTSQPVTISAGDTSALVTVAINPDAIDEAAEDFGVSAVISSTGGASITTASALDVTATIVDDDDAKVTIEAVADTVPEGTPASFAISLTDSSAPVTVFYETVDGTATSADYTTTTGTITVAGGTAETISIATTADTDVELPENFSVSITGISGSADHTPMIMTASDDVTIVDGDSATLSLSGPSAVSENVGSAVFTVALDARAESATVSYNTSDGTATDPADYSATSGLLTFGPTDTEMLVTVAITDDSTLEDSEDFSLSISLVDDGGVSITTAADSTTLTIDDEDESEVTVSRFFDAAETTGGATGLTGRFIIEMDNPSEVDTSITYSTGGDATAVTDYNALAGTIVIPAGSTSINVDVVPVNDLDVEGDETVILTLSGVGGDADVTYSTDPATVTIEDDDVSTVTVTGAAVDEDAGTATFAIDLSKPSATTVTVAYTFGGSADSPDDYGAGAGTSVVFNPGETSKEVTVSIVDDTIVEGTEEIQLSVTSITGNSLVTGLDSDNITVSDNDAAVATLIPAATPISESSSAQFIVLLSSVAQSDTTVTIDLSGTVTPGTDYTPGDTTGTVTIVGGSSSGSLFVNIEDDNMLEGSETLIGSITSISGVGSLTTAAPTMATIVVEDNDSADVTVSSSLSVDEGDGNATIAVTLSTPSDSPTVVDYSITEGTAKTGGAASIGEDDYTGTTGQVSFGIGDTVANIVVPIIDNAVVEADENFTISLLSVSSGDPSISVGSPGATDVTIYDDDSAELTIDGVSVTEGTGAGTTEATLTISQTAVSSSATTVSYSTTTATASNADYTPVTSFAVIPAGEQTAEVIVDITRDTVVEANEVFSVDLLTVTGGNADVSIGSLDSGSVTIYDDDSAVIRIPAVASADEGDGEVILTLSLTSPAASDLTIDYSVATTGTGLTDAEADDFIPSGLPSGSLEISAGATLVPLTIAINDDNIVELDETFTVSLSNLQGSTSISIDNTADVATVTIENDDSAALRVLTADGPATSVNENVGNSGLFFLSLSDESSTDTTVTYSVGGDASVGSDYDAIPTTAVIPAGEQSLAISVNVIDDTLIEDDEVISVSLESTSNSNIVINLSLNDVADATILNDDGTATLTDDVGAETITEGSDAVFVLSLSGATGSDTVIDYTLVGSTRFFSPDNMSANTLIGDDTNVSLGAGQATIAAGQTSVAVTIDTIDDSLVEDDESISMVSVSISSGVSTIDEDQTGGSVTVEDNDEASLVLVADENGFEGGPDGRFRLVLTNPVDVDTVVSLSPGPFGPAPPNAADGGGVDFETLPTEVTIGAGANSEPVDVTIVDDALPELAELVFYKADSIVSSDDDVSIVVGSDLATVSIFDNDGITVTVSDTTVDEDSGPANVVIQLSEPSPEATTVSFSLVDGSAVEAQDYDGTTGTVVIPASATTAIIPVTITDDSVVEDDEVFSVSLTGVENNGVATAFASGESADVTINSEDSATVEIVPSSTTEGDDIVVQVSLSNLSDAPTTVSIDASAGTAETTDYTVSTLALTAVIPADTATASITLASTDDDNLFESAETVLVSVTTVDTPYTGTITAGGVGTATILDNEEVTISVTAPSATATEGGADGEFLISLSGNIDEDVTVYYDTSGSATTSADYTTPSGSVVISEADLTAAVTIAAVDDSENELDETVILTANSVGGLDSTLVTADSATVTIADNDTPIVSAEFLDANVDEGDDVTLVISLDKAATDDMTVSYSIGGDATDGVDYTGLDGTVTFAASGATSVAVVVNTTDDSLVEADETIEVSISGIDSAATLAAATATPADTTVTIVDNDDALLTVSKISDAIDPESGPVTDGIFLINLSTPSLTDTTVSYSIGGTAVEGTEYDAIAKSVVIPAGQVDAFVTITPDDGSLVEEDETVEISLTAFDGDPFIEIVSTSDDMAVLTIIDEDESEISIGLSEDTVTEGDDFILNVTLSKGTEDGVVIDLAATGAGIMPGDVSGDVRFIVESGGWSLVRKRWVRG